MRAGATQTSWGWVRACAGFDDRVCVAQDKDVENADQRMTSDCSDFAGAAASVYEKVATSSVTIIVLTYTVVTRVGWQGLVLAYAFVLVAAGVARLLVRRIAALRYFLDRRTGDFRFFQTQVRINCESIAFLEGPNAGTSLHSGVRLLSAVVDTVKGIARNMFFLDAWQQFSFYGALVSAYALVGTYAFDGTGAFAGLTKSTAIIAAVTSLVGVLMSLISGMQKLLLVATTLSGLIAACGRVSLLFESCEGARGIAYAAFTPRADALEFEHVTCRTPAGVVLVRDLSLRVSTGERLLIMGPSGCGKTSLLRLLACVWPADCGTIARPKRVGEGGIFFLSQTPYAPHGSLFELIVYPTAVTNPCPTLQEQQNLWHCLNDVGLGYLVFEVGGWDAEIVPEEMLSPGQVRCSAAAAAAAAAAASRRCC